MSPGNKAAQMMAEAAFSQMDEYTYRKNLEADAYLSAHGHAYRQPAILCLVCERPKLYARDLWRGESAEFLKVCPDCWAKPRSLHLFDAVAAGRLTPQQAVEVMTWKPEPWSGWRERVGYGAIGGSVMGFVAALVEYFMR